MLEEETLTAEELAALEAEKAKAEKEQRDDDYFDVQKFEDLLTRLEASKKRQQRQKSVEGRRDIFATGLAGMMGNF